MSFHVKDDFKAGDPISSVGAGWFNKVAAFLNNLVAATGLKLDAPPLPSASAPVVLSIDSSPNLGTPTEVGGFTEDENADIEQKPSTLWLAGGKNGAELYLLYKGEYNSNAGIHDLYAAKLTISADGRIVRIDAVDDMGMEIMA